MTLHVITRTYVFVYMQEGESIPNLIPALDKDLYHWNGTTLNKLPFTADDLIDHAAFSSGYGSALVGAKVTELLGINVNTGKVCTSV